MTIGTALFLGLLAIALVIGYVGHGWLRLEKQDRKLSDGELADAIREGPEEYARWERETWEREQRSRGATDEEIRRELDSRKVVAWC